MTRIDTAHNLYIEGNHLALRLSPGPWLVDTGSGASFGRAPVLHITKEPVHVPERIRNLTPAKLKALTGCNFVGLIGNDILGELEMIFDLKRSGDGSARFHATDISEVRGRRVEVELVTAGRIPVVSTEVCALSKRMVFDTGAQYAYLGSLEDCQVKRLGRSTDFVITPHGPEVFDVDLHQVIVTLGDVTAPLTFATEPGKPTCPAPVAKLLKATGTEGILSWEILKHGPMAYLPRRGELRI